MSWVRNSRSTARNLCAAALLITASAATADILVLRSLGPSAKSFPPGKRLPENARISLKASDQLVVLDGRGTRMIRGPGNFTAGAPATGRIASAAPALPTQRRARIGAVRGPGSDELRPPSLWHVDVTKSSAICVAEPGKLTLWRPDAADEMTLNIRAARGGAAHQLTWQAGESTVAWPADLAISEGTEFRLSWKGGPAPTALTFRTLPQRPAGLEEIASLFIRNNCAAQLDLLIETVRLPEAPPAG